MVYLDNYTTYAEMDELMTLNVNDNHQPENWQTQSLRLTAFPRPDADIPPEPNWWVALIGEPPQNRNLRPKERIVQENGPYEDGKLVFGFQPNRIDWIYLAADGQEYLGDFPRALEKFRQLINRWLDLAPSLNRLAFGAVLILPTKDREIGYSKIAKYLLNVKLDAPGSWDFLYQINRPRDSHAGLNGLKINRVSKWSVATWILSTLNLTGTASPVEVFNEQPTFGCLLELDISTDANFKSELPKPKLRPLFDELVNLGVEISEKGDIA